MSRRLLLLLLLLCMRAYVHAHMHFLFPVLRAWRDEREQRIRVTWW